MTDEGQIGNGPGNVGVDGPDGNPAGDPGDGVAYDPRRWRHDQGPYVEGVTRGKFGYLLAPPGTDQGEWWRKWHSKKRSDSSGRKWKSPGQGSGPDQDITSVRARFEAFGIARDEITTLLDPEKLPEDAGERALYLRETVGPRIEQALAQFGNFTFPTKDGATFDAGADLRRVASGAAYLSDRAHISQLMDPANVPESPGERAAYLSDTVVPEIAKAQDAYKDLTWTDDQGATVTAVDDLGRLNTSVGYMLQSNVIGDLLADGNLPEDPQAQISYFNERVMPEISKAQDLYSNYTWTDDEGNLVRAGDELSGLSGHVETHVGGLADTHAHNQRVDGYQAGLDEIDRMLESLPTGLEDRSAMIRDQVMPLVARLRDEYTDLTLDSGNTAGQDLDNFRRLLTSHAGGLEWTAGRNQRNERVRGYLDKSGEIDRLLETLPTDVPEQRAVLWGQVLPRIADLEKEFGDLTLTDSDGARFQVGNDMARLRGEIAAHNYGVGKLITATRASTQRQFESYIQDASEIDRRLQGLSEDPGQQLITLRDTVLPLIDQAIEKHGGLTLAGTDGAAFTARDDLGKLRDRITAVNQDLADLARQRGSGRYFEHELGQITAPLAAEAPVTGDMPDTETGPAQHTLGQALRSHERSLDLLRATRRGLDVTGDAADTEVSAPVLDNAWFDTPYEWLPAHMQSDDYQGPYPTMSYDQFLGEMGKRLGEDAGELRGQLADQEAALRNIAARQAGGRFAARELAEITAPLDQLRQAAGEQAVTGDTSDTETRPAVTAEQALSAHDLTLERLGEARRDLAVTGDAADTETAAPRLADAPVGIPLEWLPDHMKTAGYQGMLPTMAYGDYLGRLEADLEQGRAVLAAGVAVDRSLTRVSQAGTREELIAALDAARKLSAETPLAARTQLQVGEGATAAFGDFIQEQYDAAVRVPPLGEHYGVEGGWRNAVQDSAGLLGWGGEVQARMSPAGLVYDFGPSGHLRDDLEKGASGVGRVFEPPVEVLGSAANLTARLGWLGLASGSAHLDMGGPAPGRLGEIVEKGKAELARSGNISPNPFERTFHTVDTNAADLSGSGMPVAGFLPGLSSPHPSGSGIPNTGPQRAAVYVDRLLDIADFAPLPTKWVTTPAMAGARSGVRGVRSVPQLIETLGEWGLTRDAKRALEGEMFTPLRPGMEIGSEIPLLANRSFKDAYAAARFNRLLRDLQRPPSGPGLRFPDFKGSMGTLGAWAHQGRDQAQVLGWTIGEINLTRDAKRALEGEMFTRLRPGIEIDPTIPMLANRTIRDAYDAARFKPLMRDIEADIAERAAQRQEAWIDKLIADLRRLPPTETPPRAGGSSSGLWLPGDPSPGGPRLSPEAPRPPTTDAPFDSPPGGGRRTEASGPALEGPAGVRDSGAGPEGPTNRVAVQEITDSPPMVSFPHLQTPEVAPLRHMDPATLPGWGRPQVITAPVLPTIPLPPLAPDTPRREREGDQPITAPAPGRGGSPLQSPGPAGPPGLVPFAAPGFGTTPFGAPGSGALQGPDPSSMPRMRTHPAAAPDFGVSPGLAPVQAPDIATAPLTLPEFEPVRRPEAPGRFQGGPRFVPALVDMPDPVTYLPPDLERPHLDLPTPLPMPGLSYTPSTVSAPPIRWTLGDIPELWLPRPPRKFRRPDPGRQDQREGQRRDTDRLHPHEGEFVTVRRDRVNFVTDEHHSEPLTDDNVTTFRVTKWGPESTEGKDLVVGNLRVQTKDGQVITSSIANRWRPAYRPPASNTAPPEPPSDEDMGGFDGGQPSAGGKKGGGRGRRRKGDPDLDTPARQFSVQLAPAAAQQSRPKRPRELIRSLFGR